MNIGEMVKVVAYINEMPKALSVTDVAISRAGAMATAELLAWGIPAILIPLPTAAADHQTHNARALSDAGAAVTVLEKDMNGTRMLMELKRPAEALAEYRRTLAKEPGRYRALDGARRAATAVGNRADAAKYAAEIARLTASRTSRQ
jgi:UDP-N-acetylglucosamine:LPS N-acetylglucosamine transferase